MSHPAGAFLPALNRSRALLRTLARGELGALHDWFGRSGRPSDQAMLARIEAEITLRLWLARQVANPVLWGAAFPYCLDAGARRQVNAWLAASAEDRVTSDPWHGGEPTPANDPGFRSWLRDSLAMWREAAGFIPLLQRSAGSAPEAIALPFAIHPRPHAGAPPVVPARAPAQAIDGLLDSWQQAWEHARQIGIVTDADHLQMRLCGIDAHQAGLLHGPSATWPILIALVLHQAGWKADAWTWAASGCCANVPGRGEAREINPIDARGWRAKASLIESIGVPPTATLLPGRDHPLEALICSRHTTRQMIEDAVAAMIPGLDNRQTINQVIAELEEIAAAMRYRAVDLFVVETRLNNLLHQCTRQSSPAWTDARAQAIELKATLLCHTGRPGACISLIGDLPPPEHPRGPDLRVRIAVAVSDNAYHQRSLDLCNETLDACRHFGDGAHAIETRMKAHGTSGQTLLMLALEQGDPAHATKALAHLEKAAELATLLDEDLSRARHNTPRNLAYIFLWHALMDARHAGDAYAKALASAQETGQDPGFIQRIAWLARYRLLLAGDGSAPPWWPAPDPPIPAASCGHGYPAATALKYRGALRAAEGRDAEANADFTHAASLIADRDGWLFAFIRCTILIESAHSLHRLGPPHVAPLVREASTILEQIDHLREFNPDSPAAPARWIERAKTLADPKRTPPHPDPRLAFPY